MGKVGEAEGKGESMLEVGMPFPGTAGTREPGPAGSGMKPQERSEQARNLDMIGNWMVFEAMDLE